MFTIIYIYQQVKWVPVQVQHVPDLKTLNQIKIKKKTYRGGITKVHWCTLVLFVFLFISFKYDYHTTLHYLNLNLNLYDSS